MWFFVLIAASFVSIASSKLPQRSVIHRQNMASSNDLHLIEPGPRLSSAVVHRGIVYTAGIVCEIGGEGKDVRQQTIDALADLDRVLSISGSDKHHIMSMQVWIEDMAHIAELNAVYDEWVSKTAPPGRACVEARLVPPYKVEFRAVATQIE